MLFPAFLGLLAALPPPFGVHVIAVRRDEILRWQGVCSSDEASTVSADVLGDSAMALKHVWTHSGTKDGCIPAPNPGGWVRLK